MLVGNEKVESMQDCAGTGSFVVPNPAEVFEVRKPARVIWKDGVMQMVPEDYKECVNGKGFLLIERQGDGKGVGVDLYQGGVLIKGFQIESSALPLLQMDAFHPTAFTNGQKVFSLEELISEVKGPSLSIEMVMRSEAHRWPPLSEIGKSVLVWRMLVGDIAAYERLVNSYQRLAWKLSRWVYKARCRNLTVSILDLVQEGNLGVMKALKKFDPTKGADVDTYITQGVKQKINRFLENHARNVRVSIPYQGKMRRVEKIQELHAGSGDSCPDKRTIALGFMSAEERDIINSGVAPQKLFEKMARIERKVDPLLVALHTRVERSLGLPAEDDGDRRAIEDWYPSSVYVEDVVIAGILREVVQEALEELLPREELVLVRYYGFNGKGPLLFREIGDKFGRTGERMKQIRNTAIRRLNHPRFRDRLKEWMDP